MEIILDDLFEAIDEEDETSPVIIQASVDVGYDEPERDVGYAGGHHTHILSVLVRDQRDEVRVYATENVPECLIGLINGEAIKKFEERYENLEGAI